jgi:hypothetical protein
MYLTPSTIIKNDKVKGDEIGMACSTNGAKKNACRILVGKPEGKRSLGRQEVGRWTILK